MWASSFSEDEEEAGDHNAQLQGPGDTLPLPQAEGAAATRRHYSFGAPASLGQGEGLRSEMVEPLSAPEPPMA